jgi:hypothetical protein
MAGLLGFGHGLIAARGPVGSFGRAGWRNPLICGCNRLPSPRSGGIVSPEALSLPNVKPIEWTHLLVS